MKAEAEANADADKEAKERVDKLNAADSLVFQTEKQITEIPILFLRERVIYFQVFENSESRIQ